MKPSTLLTRSTLALIVGTSVMLAACDKKDEHLTVGQQVDETIAKAKLENKAEAMGDAVKDAAIVAAINTKLAADKDLQATRIDVDAHQGHVTLQGTAPSATARDRAASLAEGTSGVVTVENHVKVSS